MTVAIAHLGPPGTYTEAAALTYSQWLIAQGQPVTLCPHPSIAQTLRAVANGAAQIAVVPVENSIEGSVPMTLDSLWQLESLQIQLALVLPISHALLSRAERLSAITTVCSHPQALAQCQGWLEKHLPSALLIPTNSTAEAVQRAELDDTTSAIASQQAATLYQMPVRAYPINDYPDNCTRFWVVSLPLSEPHRWVPSEPQIKTHTSLAFSVRANIPGTLMKPLEVFASRGINLSRIESRPTKRSLGDYLFFIDLEADAHQPFVKTALTELQNHTEVLKIFGSYTLFPTPIP